MKLEKWLDMEEPLNTVMKRHLVMERWKPFEDLAEWDVLDQNWIFQILENRRI